MSVVARFHDFPRQCTTAARRVVVSVVKSNPPLSTKEIFDLTRQVVDSPPVHSITYLKRVVLPTLVKRREVEKFHTKIATGTDIWLWRATKPKPSSQDTDMASDALPAGIADLPPAAVGVGEDWSHLNRRRRRARERKVERDLKLMSSIQEAKREAARRVLAEID